MDEMWKTVEDASNYEISSYGRVRNKANKRMLNPQAPGATGYKQVSLRLNNSNIFQKKYVHRLVAQAFLPNPENKKEVNHIDGDKLNNNLSNLEWVTSSENQIKRHEIGITQTSNRPVGKFDLDHNLIERYDSIVGAARSIGMGRGVIDKAVHGQRATVKGFIWEFLD